MSEQTQEEAIKELEFKRRKEFLERMDREQAIRDEVAKKNPQNVGVQPPDVERCPHGVPLARSCSRCDVVTDDQIKDRIPLN